MVCPGFFMISCAPRLKLTVFTACSTTSTELLELRQSMQKNLKERPIPLENVDWESDKGSAPPSPTHNNTVVGPDETIALASSSSRLLIIDTRPLDDFLAAHLPRTAHLSIPSLIFNRLRRHLTTNTPLSWASVGTFVSTPGGRREWDSVDINSPMDVVVLGLDGDDIEKPRILVELLTPLVTEGRVRMLEGGWRSIADQARAAKMTVSEEPEEAAEPLPPPAGPPTGVPPQVSHSAPSTLLIPPSSAHAPAPSQTRIPNPSMSLSPVGRNLPSLTLDTGMRSPRPPKLCINLDRTAMSATLPKRAKPTRGARPKLSTLTINVGDSNKLGVGGGPHSAFPSHGGGGGFMSARSDRSMGDQQTPLTSSLQPPVGSPWTGVSSSSAGSSTYGTPITGPIGVGMTPTGIPPPPKSPAPLEVSTILPSFLFLGPEITSRKDVDALLSLGIRRILNVAFECDDDEGLGLKTSFERYYRIPMKDSVEASGVGEGIKDAINILDDARLHSAPVYVHCKAGKSRSVTVVLAYLIHANAWTLKTSYAYVAERRHGISPNIGFVAELILFEEQELGRKASMAAADKKEDIVTREPRLGPRYTRESLPPEWAMNYGTALVEPVMEEMDGAPEARHRRPSTAAGAEIEVRKNGQWVHHRRPPVDRDTLQPGRRVSKAGLESMAIRPLRPATPQDDDFVPQF